MLLTCNMCDFKTQNIDIYTKHLYVHKGKQNGEFKCLWPNCFKTFLKYGNYNMHWHRKHSSLLKEHSNINITPLNTDNINFICNICRFSTKIFAEIAAHMRNHLKAGENIECPVQ